MWTGWRQTRTESYRKTRTLEPIPQESRWMLRRKLRWCKKYAFATEYAYLHGVLNGTPDVTWEQVVIARERLENAERALEQSGERYGNSWCKLFARG